MRSFNVLLTRPKWSVFGIKKNGHPFPIIAWAIMLVTRFKASHVLLDFPDTGDIFHAHFNSVRLQQKEKFINDSNEVVYGFKVSLDSDTYAKLRLFCLDKHGDYEGYYSLLFGILLANIYKHLTGIKIHNPFLEKATAYTCSGISMLAFQHIGKNVMFLRHYSDTITEKDIYNALDSWINCPVGSMEIARIQV